MINQGAAAGYSLVKLFKWKCDPIILINYNIKPINLIPTTL